MRARPSIYNAKPSLAASYWKNRSLVALFVPAVAFYLLFKYLPIFGVQIAFKNYMFRLGIWNSPWIGFENFEKLFAMDSFWEVLSNTFIISGLKLVFGFPAPILLALLLNEIRCVRFKRVVQTISYLPHFLSVVVVVGMLNTFLSSNGVINEFLGVFGLGPYRFLAEPKYFRTVYIASGIWQSAGWGSIIYLSALSAVEQELYEAAQIDGANRWQQMLHVTLPGIAPTITIMFILETGNIMNVSFQKILLLMTSSNQVISDVISTYVYRIGIQDANFSYATGIGLFQSIVALIFVTTANFISRRVGETSLW